MDLSKQQRPGFINNFCTGDRAFSVCRKLDLMEVFINIYTWVNKIISEGDLSLFLCE